MNKAQTFCGWECKSTPVSHKISSTIHSIDVHIHNRACSGPACLNLCSDCVSTGFWMFSWSFIINPRFLMRRERTREENIMPSFVLRGEFPWKNIHLVRQVKYSLDRQKGIIPPLPSPPTLHSKRSGSHFSVTTEGDVHSGKRSATLLLTNHSVTLRPPLQYRSQVLLLISCFCGIVKRDEERTSESGRSSPLYLSKTGECQEAGTLESTVLSVSWGELSWVHLE